MSKQEKQPNPKEIEEINIKADELVSLLLDTTTQINSEDKMITADESVGSFPKSFLD